MTAGGAQPSGESSPAISSTGSESGKISQYMSCRNRSRAADIATENDADEPRPEPIGNPNDLTTIFTPRRLSLSPHTHSGRILAVRKQAAIIPWASGPGFPRQNSFREFMTLSDGTIGDRGSKRVVRTNVTTIRSTQTYAMRQQSRNIIKRNDGTGVIWKCIRQVYFDLRLCYSVLSHILQ